MFSSFWNRKVSRMLFNIMVFLMGKEGKERMAIIYATLIVKGKKTFADVPDVIKPQVRQVLIDLDLPELAE
jgi:hypothetical protein